MEHRILTSFLLTLFAGMAITAVSLIPLSLKASFGMIIYHNGWRN
ncbi:hypothetical protein EZS27_010691 [termite gut metagenome]|uniref:Uncharacterized protein n=1 Tax=termite gut metagenome TaxID=433724 RepID=A0A5J4S862_9ZZZZ